MRLDWIQSIALGIIQGLSEFLPISSSAHLVVVPWFMSWPEHSLSFDVALHVGTLLAVLTYFRRDWLGLFRGFFMSLGRKGTGGGKEGRLFWLIGWASIPGAVIGYLLEKPAETVFRAPLLIALTMPALGVVLYLADRLGGQEKSFGQITLADSLLIGFSQAMAIIPGVSRSGITISVGLLRGMDREAAARFSFLLSTPIIAGAALLKVKYLWEGKTDPLLLVGVGASTLFGFLSIKYLLEYIQQGSYLVFVWYRMAFGLGVVLISLWR